MSISRVGVSNGTNTWTIPAHSVGDLLVTFAYRTGSTTAPSLAAGFTSILTITGTTCSVRLSYRIASATNDAAGTSTNATATVGHVYTSSLYSSGASLAIGGFAQAHASSLTVNFPALTMTNGGGTSWAAGFAGVSNTSQTISTAPAGMTNQSNEVAAASQASGFDTNGAVSSWASTNATNTGTAGNTASCTLEICENVPPAAIGNFIQHVATQGGSIAIANVPGNNYSFNKPDPTLAGNGLLCVVAYPSGATPVITDNKSNTWPVSGATGTVTADAGAGNMALQAFVLTSAVTGTQQITVGFGSTVQIPVKIWLTELYNVTGTIEGSATAAAVNVAGVVSPGSFTPSAANCLVLSYMADSNSAGTTNPALINAANGYGLNDADNSFTTGNGTPSASQAALQTTAVATTALFNLAIGGTETYNVLALALSTGTQGTPKPTGIHIDRLLYFSTNSVPASYKLQVPSTGNLMVLESPIDLNGTGNITTKDSDGVTWTNKGSVGTPIFNFRGNSTPNPSRTVTCTFTTTGQDQMLRYKDISGAAPSPYDVSVFTGATGVSNTNAISSFPSISPTTANGLILVSLQTGLGPTLGITAPTGAVYDEPAYSIAQFVAGIVTTTMTVASTTWGTVDNGAEAISGSGVTIGTTVQAGTGPTYTIQPSQTVTAGTAITQLSPDSSPVNWGNGSAHYYNPAAGAVAFSWSLANQPSNSVSVGAIAFKAPSGGIVDEDGDWINFVQAA